MIQLTSEDDYRTGCRNVNHCQQQKSYSGLFSPGRSNSTYFWNDSWVQTFHRKQNSCQARYLPEFLRKSPCRIRDPAGIARITSGASKESVNLCPEWIHRFHQLIHHDPSDLGSLILIRVLPKEHTENFLLIYVQLLLLRLMSTLCGIENAAWFYTHLFKLSTSNGSLSKRSSKNKFGQIAGIAF